ncbi:hypothetical protein [Microcoleus sp. AT3-D2]|uniref:hypothetical protein n=1 Tax=Microcoleus sp. AT3-D2 TaxID=2818612 RepID=UPI002FD15642
MTRAYDARRGRAKRSIGTEGFADNCQQKFILTAPDFRAVANPKKPRSQLIQPNRLASSSHRGLIGTSCW